MNRTNKFTQTKFKDRSPPPEPPRRPKKRCAPPVPTEGPSEELTPPTRPAVLKNFLTDIALEVVTSKPADVIDHLAEYTKNIQEELTRQREEELQLQKLMEEKAMHFVEIEAACIVIQRAFRAFKNRKERRYNMEQIKNLLADGVTLALANKAARCIQRNYRRHTLILESKRRLDEMEKRTQTLSICKRLVVEEDTTSVEERKPITEEVTSEDKEVVELYGPHTPFNPEGESFGEESPCHMAASLLTKIIKSVTALEEEILLAPEEVAEPGAQISNVVAPPKPSVRSKAEFKEEVIEVQGDAFTVTPTADDTAKDENAEEVGDEPSSGDAKNQPSTEGMAVDAGSQEAMPPATEETPIEDEKNEAITASDEVAEEEPASDPPPQETADPTEQNASPEEPEASEETSPATEDE